MKFFKNISTISLHICLGFLFFTSMAANESYDNTRIQKVEVIFPEGSEKTQEASIRERIKTKEGALFSQTDFDEDLKALAKEFDHIEPSSELIDGKLIITLKIIPKPTIARIVFQGNKAITAERLQKELNIGSGAIFDRTQFNKAFHKLKSYYVRKGYFEAELDYAVTSNKQTGTITIEVIIREGRSGRIQEIAFTGFTNHERDEILELMNTKEYSWWSSWLTGSGTHKPEVIRQDELLILNYLHNQGYADAKVNIAIVDSKEKGRIIIQVHADKGDCYYFGDVKIAGATLFTEEELTKSLPFKKGDLYSPDKMRDANQHIADAYGRRGYVDAVVTPEAHLIDGKKIYDVSFTVQEGKRYRVGLIKVFGNMRTQSGVILHESLLTPGEVFDTTMMRKTEERLRNIGYFETVNVYAVKSKQETGTGDVGTGEGSFRDVHIEVEEKNTTANFRASAGYSTSPKMFTFGLGLSEYNFNSAGIPYIFKKGLRGLRGGGEYLGFDATFGSKILSYTLSWSKPYFLDSRWTVGVDFNKLRNSYASNDYTIKSYSATPFASYQINPFLSFGLRYRLRHSFIKLKGIRNTHRNHQLIHESRNGGLISAVGADFSYNSTDNFLLPTRGLKSSIGAEYAGLGGDHRFAKFSYLNSLYYSPYKGGILKLRGDVQFIKTLGSTHGHDLPLDERLYTGGETTIRGFVYNRVGPKFHDKKRTVRGGLSEVLLSAEFNQYIMKRIDGFVFFDAGNVYFQQFHLGQLRASYGYGIKIKIRENAAPLCIGIGYPINPGRRDDVKRFFLSFGTNF